MRWLEKTLLKVNTKKIQYFFFLVSEIFSFCNQLSYQFLCDQKGKFICYFTKKKYKTFIFPSV